MGRAGCTREVRHDPLDVGLRSQLLETRSRCVQLERRGLVVAESATCESDELTRSCHLVRRLQPLPHVAGLAKRGQRGARVVLGEQHGSASERDHADEHRALVAFGHLLQLERGTPRGFEVARGEHDLDARCQQPDAREGIVGLVQDASNRGHGDADLPLRKSQLGETRLGFPSVPARLEVRVLRLVELSEQPMELRFPVPGEPDPTLVPRVDEALLRPLRLLERIRPFPVQLHDLRAMYEAPTGERQHVRLALAPPREGRSPLSSAADLVDLPTREDHAAIDDARRDRRQLSRNHGHHCLVEEGKPLLHSARLDQHQPLSVSRERESIGISEPLGDRGGLGGDRRP